MKKIQIGDIFELETAKGKGYLHYVYKDDSYGELIRILPGLYSERPSKLEGLASGKERYMIFFPVGLATRKKSIQIVGFYSANNFGIPRYMRSPHLSETIPFSKI
jgi:hypothetical protein